MYQIYKITNKINNKYYIGIHKGNIFDDDYYGSGVLIKRSVSMYGKHNFSREVIGEYQSKYLAEWMERALVGHSSVESELCYNLTCGGRTLTMNDTIKEKISKAHIGKTLSDETKKKMSEAGKGRIFTEEHRKKISDALRGRKHSEERVLKMREARKGKLLGKDNPSSSSVMHIESEKIFNTVTDASNYFDCSRQKVTWHCQNKAKSPEFKYIE